MYIKKLHINTNLYFYLLIVLAIADTIQFFISDERCALTHFWICTNFRWHNYIPLFQIGMYQHFVFTFSTNVLPLKFQHFWQSYSHHCPCRIQKIVKKNILYNLYFAFYIVNIICISLTITMLLLLFVFRYNYMNSQHTQNMSNSRS